MSTAHISLHWFITKKSSTLQCSLVKFIFIFFYIYYFSVSGIIKVVCCLLYTMTGLLYSLAISTVSQPASQPARKQRVIDRELEQESEDHPNILLWHITNELTIVPGIEGHSLGSKLVAPILHIFYFVYITYIFNLFLPNLIVKTLISLVVPKIICTILHVLEKWLYVLFGVKQPANR